MDLPEGDLKEVFFTTQYDLEPTLIRALERGGISRFVGVREGVATGAFSGVGGGGRKEGN